MNDHGTAVAIWSNRIDPRDRDRLIVLCILKEAL